MLIKIYSIPKSTVDNSERLHIIDNAQDVVVHQGNWEPPSDLFIPIDGDQTIWGPYPVEVREDLYDCRPGETVRLIDYTKEGIRHRALINRLAYVCNDSGKTIERVELYSGAYLSKLNT